MSLAKYYIGAEPAESNESFQGQLKNLVSTILDSLAVAPGSHALIKFAVSSINSAGTNIAFDSIDNIYIGYSDDGNGGTQLQIGNQSYLINTAIDATLTSALTLAILAAIPTTSLVTSILR